MSASTASASAADTIRGEGPGWMTRWMSCAMSSRARSAATGFIIKGTDTAAVDEKTIEENVKSTGIVELSLSWR
jgi:hypothetical protein